MVVSSSSQPTTNPQVSLFFLEEFFFLVYPLAFAWSLGKGKASVKSVNGLQKKNDATFFFFFSGVSFAWLLRKIECVCEVGDWPAKT